MASRTRRQHVLLGSLGYTLPERLVPDISEGRMFAQWLRDEHDLEPNDFPTYQHRYEDGRVVNARLYPNNLLADFREHFQTVWLPQRAPDYFGERDPIAVPYLTQLIEAQDDPGD